MSGGRTTNKILAVSVLVSTGVALLVLYVMIDPGSAVWMPKCLFHQFTGLECPGCGSQRALHALLHGELGRAWAFNPLVVAGLPLMILMGVAAICRKRYPRLYMILNSTLMALIASVAIVAWFIIRNFIL